MKKVLSVVILFFFILVGCSNPVKVSDSNSNTNNNDIESKDKEKVQAYILAFDNVFKMDDALNSDIKYISIDTKSFQGFNEENKQDLFKYVADKYSVTVLDMSIEELKDKGYVKDLFFKDGIVFRVDKYNENSPNNISFEGAKWRSGTGAIGFTFKAQKKDEKWQLKKCEMTWIS